MRGIVSLFRLDTDDMELVRAQFHSFSKQVPLLYLILISNVIAIMIECFRLDLLIETVIAPLIICALALGRAHWWWRQDLARQVSDADMARTIRRTCTVAVLLALVFDGWCIWLYRSSDAYARGHLTFFLALTEVSTVFCLMTMRAAAMRVAATGTLLFVVYFMVIDEGHMVVEALVLCVVTLGMMLVTHRYNLDFLQLIRSKRELRDRQAETEKLSEENRRSALTDALSGLPNRRDLLDRLDRIESAQRDAGRIQPIDDPTSDRPAPDGLAVVFIDLDGFKAINDAHGHIAGDTMIRSLSARLLAICPANATLARVGGDEFAVLIEAGAESLGAGAAALALARAIREEISRPVLVDRLVLQVGASIGVASNGDGPLAAHELLRRADTAMYHVKLAGKGAIAVYDPAFDEGRMRRLVIENEIGQGLARGEFEVVYQPVVDAQRGAIVGAEALVRWPRRPAGALAPDQFIGIAEATGQILPLGLFVLERACRDMLSLRDIKLSVNVSPAQFRDPGFARQVAHVLEQTRFPPERLQFEITEGYLLAHPERATRAIDEFKAMGMTIALDDFGTGFTSIHYLQSYGFSHIKLDKSLLVGLRPGNKASLLVTGAINLARGLDMDVIAEGVETEDQATILRSAGCHQLQGYLYGRPMPIGDLLIGHSAPVAPAPVARAPVAPAPVARAPVARAPVAPAVDALACRPLRKAG